MSWWVCLEDKGGQAVAVDLFEEGGTHVLGGSEEAELNVTYNYGGLFRAAFDGMGLKEALDGKQAFPMIALLVRGIEQLGDAPDGDYWAATPGNAGHALAILLRWAQHHRWAYFRVS